MTQTDLSLTQSEELLRFFKRYLSFYTELLELERRKLSDILNNQLSSLDQHVKAEEACTLRARGLEQEKEALLRENGLEEFTFRKILPLVHPLKRQELTNLHQDLSELLLDLKAVNYRCNHLTQLKLRQIYAQMDRLEASSANRRPYSALAQQKNDTTGLLFKRI